MVSYIIITAILSQAQPYAFIITNNKSENKFMRDAAALCVQNNFIPITMEEINVLLEAEKAKDIIGCTDVTCFTDIAGGFGVRYIVTIKFFKKESYAIISIRDVEKMGKAIVQGLGFTLPRPNNNWAHYNGESIWFHYKKGITLLNGGQTKKAIGVFSRCVQADRSFCLCHRALGISYAREGNGSKASRYYRLYLKYCPTAKDAHRVEKVLKDYGL